MKVAIVTDWLNSKGGAEKVTQHIAEIYPKADIYTSIYKKENFPSFKDRKVYTSFINNLPFAHKLHFIYLFLMPYAFENMNFDDYDLVINSNWACSKGIITNTETKHIIYMHNPTRYVWDDCHKYLNQYNIPKILKLIAKPFLNKLRTWDFVASQRNDGIICNSSVVQKRIKKYYHLDSTVINPAFENRNIKIKDKKENYYLAGGRLIPYKQFELIVKAFNINKKNLKIYGKGRLLEKLKKLNTNPNTEFLGYVDDKKHQSLLENAKAFLFPQKDDFGIVAAESIQHGCPVIAFKKGGVVDIIKEKQNGIFFEEQTKESLNQAIEKFEKMKFLSKEIVESSKKFTKQEFQKKFKLYIDNILNEA